MESALDKNHDFYFRLRQRFNHWINERDSKEHRWADILLLTPDMFYLVWKLSLDSNVPGKTKAALAGVAAYFILPLDFIPEALFGPVGFLDDIAISAFMLNKLVVETSPEIVRKYWLGEHDILISIKNILGAADTMLGRGLWRRLRRRFGGF